MTLGDTGSKAFRCCGEKASNNRPSVEKPKAAWKHSSAPSAVGSSDASSYDLNDLLLHVRVPDKNTSLHF